MDSVIINRRDWIELAHDWIRYLALVLVVLNLRIKVKVNGKVVPVLSCNRAPRHEGVLGSGGIASRSGRFTPRERAPGTHWIRGCSDISSTPYVMVMQM
jgi:hypothetical protein